MLGISEGVGNSLLEMVRGFVHMVTTVQFSTAELWTTVIYLVQVLLMIVCTYGVAQKMAIWRLGGEKAVTAEAGRKGAPCPETGPSHLELEQQITEKMARITGPNESTDWQEPPESDPIVCDICDGLTLNGGQQYRDHVNMKKHRDRVQAMKDNAEVVRVSGLAGAVLRKNASAQTRKRWVVHADVPAEIAERLQRAATPDELLEAVLQWYQQAGLEAPGWRWAHNNDGGGVMIAVGDEGARLEAELVPMEMRPELHGMQVRRSAGGVEAQTILRAVINLAQEGDVLWVSAYTYDRIDEVCDPLIAARARRVKVYFIADKHEALWGKTDYMKGALAKMEANGVPVRLAQGWNLGEHYRAVGRTFNGKGRMHMKAALLDRSGLYTATAGRYRAKNSYLLAGSTNWTTSSRGNREMTLLSMIAPNAPASTMMLLRRPFEDGFQQGVSYNDAIIRLAQTKE